MKSRLENFSVEIKNYTFSAGGDSGAVEGNVEDSPGAPRKVAVYNIVIQEKSNTNSWVLSKTYDDFETLHSVLSTSGRYEKALESYVFPPRTLIFETEATRKTRKEKFNQLFGLIFSIALTSGFEKDDEDYICEWLEIRNAIGGPSSPGEDDEERKTEDSERPEDPEADFTIFLLLTPFLPFIFLVAIHVAFNPTMWHALKLETSQAAMSFVDWTRTYLSPEIKTWLEKRAGDIGQAVSVFLSTTDQVVDVLALPMGGRAALNEMTFRVVDFLSDTQSRVLSIGAPPPKGQSYTSWGAVAVRSSTPPPLYERIGAPYHVMGVVLVVFVLLNSCLYLSRYFRERRM
jgi:hypothetical protein